MTILENLNYVGEVPSSEFWEGKRIPDEFLTFSPKEIHDMIPLRLDIPISACDIISQMTASKIFNFSKVYRHYQVLDCVSLCAIYNKIWRCIWNFSGMNMINAMTTPQMAVQYLKYFIPADLVKNASHRSVDYWIRNSIQGGKVFPQKGIFIPEIDKKFINFWVCKADLKDL